VPKSVVSVMTLTAWRVAHLVRARNKEAAQRPILDLGPLQNGVAAFGRKPDYSIHRRNAALGARRRYVRTKCREAGPRFTISDALVPTRGEGGDKAEGTM